MFAPYSPIYISVMPKERSSTIHVQGSVIQIRTINDEDYISLTDMVRNFPGTSALIEQWLRNKDTIEFLGVWEQINHSEFNSLEFEGIRNDAGTNRFYLSAKIWIEKTNAKGLVATAGRFGGTYAQKDIAFEFGSWLSPQFKLYLITEFQRLKKQESSRSSEEWNLHRTLAKINYRIHTDAVLNSIIPNSLSATQLGLVYASEADILNMALFGMTAKTWRNQHPEKSGNMRDHATLEQLLVLANLEALNAEYLKMELPQPERLKRLNENAIHQLKLLTKKPIQKAFKKTSGKPTL